MNGARSRRKGANAERDFVSWLRGNGWPDARRYLAGDGRQPGDIDAIPGVCMEVKNHRVYDFPAWLRQAVAEADGRLPVLIVKPNGTTDPGDWWMVMRVRDGMPLLEVAS